MKRSRDYDYWYGEFKYETDEGDVIKRDFGFFSSVDKAIEYLSIEMKRIKEQYPKFDYEKELDSLGVNLIASYDTLTCNFTWLMINIEEALDNKIIKLF
jgi:hypothetical protein